MPGESLSATEFPERFVEVFIISLWCFFNFFFQVCKKVEENISHDVFFIQVLRAESWPFPSALEAREEAGMQDLGACLGAASALESKSSISGEKLRSPKIFLGGG